MIRIGVDFGGTKIEVAAIDDSGEFCSRLRAPTPDTYEEAIATISRLVTETEQTLKLRQRASVGIGTPGSVCRVTGKLRNSNRQYLNGSPLTRDLEAALQRPIRIANDANCFALSEAYDGAAGGKQIVCGLILGTGCGGGLVIGGQLIEGANGIAAEWGHNPLPWADLTENNGPACYCGRKGCLEQWISGTALTRCFSARTGKQESAKTIAQLAQEGDTAAIYEISALINRVGRAIASLCNVVDPDVVVIGGGLSNIPMLYKELPSVIEQYVFNDTWRGSVLPPRWGDSSGVRGAARLWATP
ncbi:ROK family protein [Gilvimarinus sp. 2_MG-2023]|uniref:ROK family protein n=1 Tax=Gilvimarinus sp. 2_MG-2023 TaxID=3062666 RepID=UPI0026E375E3|nr:ROK family protein [Gilvimarinus sp. 2_MG-2023]MDO6569597.1 ROK family protein [Gilvimarinus sp. 2_MG-2023]